MEFVVEPEPEPREREALTRALERLLAGDEQPAPYRSAWRQTGIAANVRADYAIARPRSTFGATRA